MHDSFDLLLVGCASAWDDQVSNKNLTCDCTVVYPTLVHHVLACLLFLPAPLPYSTRLPVLRLIQHPSCVPLYAPVLLDIVLGDDTDEVSAVL